MFSSNTSQVSNNAVFVEDVFSTWLYTGTNSARTITNGIDLAGKGGMVWFKNRNTASYANRIFDTDRGATNFLTTNTNQSQFSNANTLTAFNSNGFNLGSDGSGIGVNQGTSNTYASWTFRKQPKFFTSGTYTGNGSSNRVITHDLGSTPGCIIIKGVSGATANSGWVVWHRSAPSGGANGLYNGLLNTADSFGYGPFVNSVGSTSFNIFDPLWTNESGNTYEYYAFAHNAGGFGLTGTDNVISCGSFTTDGSGNATVNLGYEPQWMINKAANNPQNWIITDNMRGWFASSSPNLLLANTSDAEFAATNLRLTSTGFSVTGYAANQTSIYIAIRRGPMKTPTSGTSVFKPQVITANGVINAGFPSDSTLTAVVPGLRPWAARITGGYPMYTNLTNSESSSSYYNYGYSQNSYDYNFGVGASNRALMYDMRRAPGFFDVVCYTGTGATNARTHNLTVAPELIICKSRSAVEDWFVLTSFGASTFSVGYLNTTLALTTGRAYTSTADLTTRPTATTFSLGSGGPNTSGSTYIAYLFASCPGVSKVGSYTGNDTSQNIDCGFTAGARFVLIKRTSSTSDWYVFDTARGFSSEAFVTLNTNTAEGYSPVISTLASGFTVSQTGEGLNAAGQTYIYLAIA